jgi:hypothetical protein
MTETTAKSGAPATPVDEKPAESGASATGRATVGRATVPADAASPAKFTRAPGMAPPPEEPAASDGSAEPTAVGKPASSVPIVAKAKKAVAAAAEAAANAVKKEAPVAGKTDTAPRTGSGPASTPGSATGRSGATTTTRPGTVTPPPDTRTAAAAGSAAVGAARVTEAVRAARSAVSSAAARGPRRARLNLKRIDPWSVMKFAFAVSVVLFIVVVVATAVLYLSLDAMGVWAKVNETLAELLSAGGGASGASAPFHVTAWGVIGTSMLIGAVNVVLFTALATLSAFVYNVCADLVGGVELTLAERD